MNKYSKNLLIICLLIFCGNLFSQDGYITYNSEDSKLKFDNIYENLTKKPKWLFVKDKCPLEVMSKKESTPQFTLSECEQDAEKCLKKCKESNGSACYWLAVQIQIKKEVESDISEKLFQRACKLGVPSGCTNRAATIFNNNKDKQILLKCAVDTFEETCKLDDPWGCTMFANALMLGLGREQDLQKALEVLKKSCTYGEADRACSSALEMTKMIQEFLEKQKKNNEQIGKNNR